MKAFTCSVLYLAASFWGCSAGKVTPGDGGDANATGAGGGGGSMGAGAAGGMSGGGGSSGAGAMSGASGTPGGGGTGGASGRGGAGGTSTPCPMDPANDPACPHITIYPLTANALNLRTCTPGIACNLPVGHSTSCDQAYGFAQFVCCDMPPLSPTSGWEKTAFVPGVSTAVCPRPVAGQDPSCALPLADTCTNGVTCSYGNGYTDTPYLDASCCGGKWVGGASCP